MNFEYIPKGTCSRRINFEIDESGCLRNVCFTGGCPGNTVGVASLAEGRDARQVACALKGTPCRDKGTSCPDQLAKAIEEALATANA
ncbi:MAG: TIGR03905 family TSCPD domain-containing protein [Muribaculaceae bacterium]|nr:TIGR03905 family TSCPD domain-containing protein [Muribaculaceae bacterium]MDE6196281.1 TIGR03905 family TSCPD domain-containing protein [Muribaculaceae bacterium]